MTNADDSSSGIIESALSATQNGIVAGGGSLLQLFAEASSHYIGELGFSSMLFRCAQCVAADFSWIPADARYGRGMPQLSRIESIIAKQDPVQARCSRICLLHCFVDFLTLMIGASASMLILHRACGRALAGPQGFTESKH